MRSLENASRVAARLTAFPRERPRLATVLCVLVASAFPLVAFHQVAFGGKTLSTALILSGVNGSHPPTGSGPYEVGNRYRVDPGASAWQTEPWVELNDRQYASGEWPLWNPHQGAGTPHAANTISATFDPLLAVVNIHATPLTWDLSILFAFCLGSGATFMFVLLLGNRRLAALVGAAVFSIGGYFALYSNNPFARGYIYLPILLLLVDRVIADRGPPWTVALGVALAASILVGMPEVSFLVVATSVLYALYRLFTAAAGRLRRAALLRLGVAAILGLALASPLLVIFAQYEPLAFNLHKAGGGTGTAVEPLRAVVTWAIPFLDGRRSPAVFDPNLLPVRAWVGAGALAAVAVCLASPWQFLVARRAPFFLGLGVIVGWKVYGLPGSKAVGRLPLLERINFPAFFTTVLQFSIAVLVAVGIDAILRGGIRGRRLAVTTTVALIVAAVGLERSRGPLEALTGDYTLRWVGLAAVSASVVLVAAWVMVARPSWRLAAGAASALVIVVELFMLFPTNTYEQRVDPYRTPGWQTLIERSEGNNPQVDRIFGLDGVAYPDTATALGLYDVRDLDALYVDRYFNYVRRFLSPRVLDRFVGGPVVSAEGLPLYANNPMFDLLGVKHVLSDAAGATDGKDPLSGPQYRQLGTRDAITVHENLHAMPRAFLVRDLTIVRNKGAAMSYLRSAGPSIESTGTLVERFDPRTQAVVEAAHGTGLSRVGPCRNSAADRVAITRYRPQDVRLRVHAGCAGLLVLSDTYFPGWRATVNGHGTTILPTDYLLRGVRIPAGASTVVFHYEPSHFGAAVWLARLATLAAIVWLAVWAVRKRRRTAAPSTA